jgi:holo-[acyl-carrier protein] synthase
VSNLRVGVDICDITQVANAIETFADRYLTRVYTPHELASCRDSGDFAARLGARFAAKEAVIKVLRPSDSLPDWRSIEVQTAADGSCAIALTGLAGRLAHEAGISNVAVSLTHEGSVAAAVAIAICGEPSICGVN